jgi:calcium binding protein 39
VWWDLGNVAGRGDGEAFFHFTETESSPEQVYQLVVAIIQEDVLLALARAMHKMPFESRKDAQVIFSYVLRFKPPGSADAADPMALSFVVNHRPEVVTAICRGYDRKESALPCGTVLREILKHEAITAIILYDEPARAAAAAGSAAAGKVMPAVPQTGEGVFWRFFDWIEKGTFEVSADAFTTFRVSHGHFCYTHRLFSFFIIWLLLIAPDILPIPSKMF